MKAVILAAGKGIRMLPLTENIPKVLVEVNGKPFLWYVINNLKEAGYNELGIVVGYKKEKVQEFLKEYNFQATLIEQAEQKGTGHAVQLAKEFVGNENFLVYYGDSLFSVDDLKAANIDDDLSYMPGKKVTNWQKYGIMIEEDGFLKKKVEKPSTFVGDLAWVGFVKTTPEIFPKLDKVTLSSRGEIEITDAINMLAKEKKVKVLPINDFWLDLSGKEDILKVEEFLRKNSIEQ